MEITSVGKAFTAELSIKQNNFLDRIMGISEKLGLRIITSDIPEETHDLKENVAFDFLQNIEDKYNLESITASQFIFLTTTLAFRHHSMDVYFSDTDMNCINYLMSIFKHIRKKSDFSPEMHDFYKWFIKHRPR